MNTLLIIGTVPATSGIGGVTIHVQRLLDSLDASQVPYTFVDYRKSSLMGIVKAILKAKVIHLHMSTPKPQLLITSLSRLLGRKVIVTIHGNYGRFNCIGNFCQKMTVKYANLPILINLGSYNKCRSLNKRATLIPAFIPPQKEEKLQDELLSLFDNLHNGEKIVVSTNAYNISYDKAGNDTYGIGFLVDFFEKSKDYTLVVSDPSGNYTKMYERIKKKGNGQNTVIFINYPHSYYELLKHVDFFVRNTSTDGDALSVKEALYLGVPVLCSDVVDRPSGVRLFKYSDKDSFEKALNTPQEANINIENGALSLLEIYRGLDSIIS